MFDRNYFGMMMVETGEADAFIAGTYSGGHEAADIAKTVIGIRPSYGHFASLHILNTKRGVYFLADTMINETADEDTLYDVSRLARNAVEYFAREPRMAPGIIQQLRVKRGEGMLHGETRGRKAAQPVPRPTCRRRNASATTPSTVNSATASTHSQG